MSDIPARDPALHDAALLDLAAEMTGLPLDQLSKTRTDHVTGDLIVIDAEGRKTRYPAAALIDPHSRRAWRKANGTFAPADQQDADGQPEQLAPRRPPAKPAAKK